VTTHGQQRAMELAQVLINGTKAGKTKWQKGTGGSYIFARSAGSVSVWSRDNDGDAPFGMTIFDRDGAVIETVEQDFSDRLPPDWNVILAELYGVARSDALNIDLVVDGLLKAVEEGEPPPPPPPPADDFAPGADDDIPF
jgi:hypothetical protein